MEHVSPSSSDLLLRTSRSAESERLLLLDQFFSKASSLRNNALLQILSVLSIQGLAMKMSPFHINLVK